jgi:hypothetical protein
MTIIAQAAAMVAFVLLGSPSGAVAAQGCCSQKHLECTSWAPTSLSQCKDYSGGKYLWLPEGEGHDPNPDACKELWQSGSCSLHTDCCGALVCDGMSWDISNKQCQHPIDLCSSFNDEAFCSARSSCEWKDYTCVPNFDYSILAPASFPALSGATTSTTPIPTSNVKWEDTTPDSYCPAVNNLGEGYSAAIGYTGTFPTVSNNGPTGRGTDDAVSFLVGGNYLAPAAAEIEGKAVVLGDFVIGSQGTNSIGKYTNFMER